MTVPDEVWRAAGALAVALVGWLIGRRTPPKA